MENHSRSVSQNILKHVVGSDRRGLASALAMSAAGGVIELVGVGTLYPFLSLLYKPELIHQRKVLSWLYGFIHCSDFREFIIAFGFLSLGAFVFACAFLYLKNAYLLQYSLRQSARLSGRILENYLHKPYLFFLDQNSGEIAKNVIAQTDAVASQVLVSWMTIIAEIPILTALIGLILCVDLKAGLVIIAGLGAFVSTALYGLRRRITRLGAAADERNSLRFISSLQALQSIKEIKVAQKEDFFIRRFQEPARSYASAFSRVNALQILPGNLLQAVAVSAVMGLAIYYLAIGRPPGEIVPVLTLYGAAGFRLIPSLRRLSDAVSNLRSYQAVFENVIQILALRASASPASAQRADRIRFERDIELRDISFSYPGMEKNRVLDGIRLHIKKGTFVALVGSSGAGKTTLADILLGLFPMTGGKILVDGRSLSPQDMGAWTSMIGYIPQSICLLGGTVAANIAFGIEDEDIDWERVRKAAGMAQISDFIDRLPEGFKSLIGERGAKLSGGERQRLGIARALYQDPEVLLMDESTSALDGVAERKIVATVHELKRRKTIIAIAHRPSTIRSADMIYLLEGGKIAAEGTSESLLRDCPRFAELMAHPLD